MEGPGLMETDSTPNPMFESGSAGLEDLMRLLELLSSFKRC